MHPPDLRQVQPHDTSTTTIMTASVRVSIIRNRTCSLIPHATDARDRPRARRTPPVDRPPVPPRRCVAAARAELLELLGPSVAMPFV